jgi:hypothetical protein
MRYTVFWYNNSKWPKCYYIITRSKKSFLISEAPLCSDIITRSDESVVYNKLGDPKLISDRWPTRRWAHKGGQLVCYKEKFRAGRKTSSTQERTVSDLLFVPSFYILTVNLPGTNVLHYYITTAASLWIETCTAARAFLMDPVGTKEWFVDQHEKLLWIRLFRSENKQKRSRLLNQMMFFTMNAISVEKMKRL